MFTKSARFYDAIYSFKDYAVEAARVAEEVRHRFGTARTLLDVACGTGKHLEYLKAHFEVTGLDLDPALLESARARLPDVPLEEGDMADFSLDRRFDAVTCLFSSIGYLLEVDRLQAAVRNMGTHLSPGGVLVVEPWLAPQDFEDGHVGALLVDEEDLKIARLNNSYKEGAVSRIAFHYLISENGGEVVHEVEEHRLGLFTDAEYRDAFAAAGLSVEHDPEGLIGRGLYIGVKS